jgi:assimilatory nitrate reductase catalytic subunit
LAGWARRLLGAGDEETDWIEYEDQGGGVYRAAHLVDGRMEACVFISRRQDLPARAWLAGLFEREVLDAAERGALLAGQPKSGGADPGPTVCSCFGVGRNTICAAIRERGLKDAASVTACVKAGGNCGSCVPEIRRLVAEAMVADEA